MKKTLFLSLALVVCGQASAETRLLAGVTTTSGFFDVSKHLIREDGQIDSQTCAAVTASNMLAYWYSQHPEATTDTVDKKFAEGIYDYIFNYTKNASTTISEDCNYYASNHNQASAPAVYTTATYVPKAEGFKVDVTPEGYELTGSLYTSMGLQEAIQWGLDNNLAMGLTMNQTPGKGAHALTIWGGEFTSYGDGSPVQMNGIYYTNSDNEEGMNYASFSTAFNADGDTEYYFNDGSGRRWKVVELAFLLDPYAIAPEITDTNSIGLGAKTGNMTGYYYAGGAHETATSFDLHDNAGIIIGEGMELNSSQVHSEDERFRAELSGKGTYVAKDFSMGYAKLGKDWSGTVRLTGKADTLSTGTLDSASVNGSLAELSAASIGDWKEEVATVKGALKLTNNSSTGAAALSITAADGTKNITFAGAVSGSGDIRLANDKENATHSYTFSGDVQEWTGTLRSALNKDSELNVYFTNNKEVNTNVENVGAGKVSVSFEKGAVINSDLLNLSTGSMTVTAEAGTTFNGDLVVNTLVLNGQVTINAAEKSGASTKSLPAGDPDFTNTEHFNVQEMVFNNGSSLTLNGDFDLSKTTITLSQDYINALTAGSTTTLISAGTGSTLSGMATLDEALSGYNLAMENGNLVLKAAGATDSIDFTLQSVALTGNELTLTPVEAIHDGLNLAALDSITIAVNSAIINELFADGADPNTQVSLTIGTYKDLTNVTFVVDGQNSYSGEGNGRYRLGNIPEPATTTLSLLALTALAARRKRK